MAPEALSSPPGQGGPAWFPCPGCDRVVTSLVREAPEAGHHAYSSSHCCHECEARAPEGHSKDCWRCASVPSAAFRELRLPGAEAPAHYLLHDPGPGAAGGELLPAVLFLHGSMTYLYPETLWWDVKGLVEKNMVVAKHFVVIAPFGAVGEPIAKPSCWTKANRFGVDVPYVEKFDEDAAWVMFLGAIRALGPGRVDPARLHVMGYSMGGQGSWNIAVRYGSRLASVVPIAGSCSWSGDAWANQAAHLAELRSLPLWAYCGAEDGRAVSWRDFWWVADRRGLPSRAVEREVDVQVPTASLTVHEWSTELSLGLVRDTSGRHSNHCIWDTIFHNEDGFGLFSRMLAARCQTPLSANLEAEPPFPASRCPEQGVPPARG
uniref:Peptidase S9 prolyl oligopeptidase catalytic domain-containing protein n=1 Tax=Alexandrium monilatum TaxID=311494 RepID=A0A7S4PSW1_9DINO